MKNYNLTQENVKMIVDALDFSIDALKEAKRHRDKIAHRLNYDCCEVITTKIAELTTLKNYLEQY